MTQGAAASPGSPRAVPGPPVAPEGRRSLRVTTLAAVAAALAVLAGGMIVDAAYFGNAVVIDWRIPARSDRLRLPGAPAAPDLDPIVIGTSVEHDVSIPSSHRAITRYVESWRVADHGPPHEMPALDAMVRARLTVPPGVPRGLMVRTGDRVELVADDVVLERTDRLAPGAHEIAVHWSGELDVGTSFELCFENGEPVPRALLHPPRTFSDGEWPPSRRWFWTFAVMLAAVLATMTARATSASTPALARSRALAIATLLVVLFGGSLRAYDYDLEPHPLENYDEYFNLWNGWSLLEDGSSRGWTQFGAAYPIGTRFEELSFWGTDLVVVTPYFENPPLMHLLAGAAAHIGGATDFRDARVAHGRLASLGLSVLTIWLLIAVTRRFVRVGPAPWIAGLLWAAIPTLVLQTRVIKEELVVVPLALGSLLAFMRWRDEGRAPRDLAVAAVCAGLAILAKAPAVALLASLVVLVALERSWRSARHAALVGALAGIAPLLLFVLFEGLPTFLAAQAAQTSMRGMHFNLFPRFFDVMQVNGWFVGRGWVIFLWLAAMSAMASWRPAHRAALAVPLTAYLVSIGVASANFTFGWYLLPIAAYLCIAAGTFLGDLYERPDLLRGALFGLLFVMYTLNFVAPATWMGRPDPYIRPLVTIAVLALTAPYAIAQLWPSWRPLARGTLVVSGTVTGVIFASIVLRWEELWQTLHNVDRDLFFP